jgi:hypothetical protein
VPIDPIPSIGTKHKDLKDILLPPKKILKHCTKKGTVTTAKSKVTWLGIALLSLKPLIKAKLRHAPPKQKPAMKKVTLILWMMRSTSKHLSKREG